MKILFQNENIIVCVKPAGIISADEPGGMPELIKKQTGCPEIYTVHRLDQVVGGAMIFAKNHETASRIGKGISGGEYLKQYLAVVHGRPETERGQLYDFLLRNEQEKKTYVYPNPRKGAKEAILDYELLEERDGLSLLKITLHTGRTHQIRAQLSAHKMPIAGDRKYGAKDSCRDVALWSNHLRFKVPEESGETDIVCPPPKAYPWTEFNIKTGSYGEEYHRSGAGEQILSCPYKSKCGGCGFKDITYEKQLGIKQGRLIRTLGKFGRVEDIVPCDDPYHYRNKVHAAFGLDRKNNIISGVYEQDSHRIVPVDSCLLEDETADGIIRDIKSMLRPYKILVYDERRGTGFLRHVQVRRSAKTGEVMVTLVAANPYFKQQKPFVNELVKRHPEIKSVILNINDGFTPVVLGEREKVLYGSGYITDELMGKRFRISSKSFYQINSRQTEKLYSTALELAGLTGREKVLDAYCGTGTIGICAAGRAEQVVGVEINADAVHDAIANAKANSVKNIWFYTADAEKYIVEEAKHGASYDVVFMDPPRSGSTEGFINALFRLKSKKIIYVSCSPDTLARDLELLTKGYRVEKLVPVDMFPWTEHVEAVSLLSRV